MCFSAGASFGASAVLCAIGTLALKKTTTSSQIMFAAIPLIFSAQQFTEGLAWLSLSNPANAAWQSSSQHAFLFVAEVLWPIWAPLALLHLEQEPVRRKILLALTGIGLFVSLVLGYHLAVYPVHAGIDGHHIHYEQNLPLARLWFGALVYVLPTAAPLFISSIKKMWIMGVSLMASYLVTELFYSEYLTSVWCYFAALISIEVVVLIHYAPEDHDLPTEPQPRTDTGTP